MLVRLAQGLYILLYALVAGVMWGTWLSLARTMTRYDPGTFLADGQHMIANLATIMPILMISTAVLGLVLTIVLFRRRLPAAGWLALAGLVLLGVVIAVTLAVNVPIDNEIKRWTAATLPSDWASVRSRWADFHTLRTFVSLAGLVAVIGSAVTMGAADRSGGARHRADQPVAPATLG
jgi:uncharacterized membrane protein